PVSRRSATSRHQRQRRRGPIGLPQQPNQHAAVPVGHPAAYPPLLRCRAAQLLGQALPAYRARVANPGGATLPPLPLIPRLSIATGLVRLRRAVPQPQIGARARRAGPPVLPRHLRIGHHGHAPLLPPTWALGVRLGGACPTSEPPT